MTNNDLILSRAIELYRNEVEVHGLRVEQVFDFDLLAEVCAQRSEEENTPFSLTEPFSNQYFDFTPANGFWVGVWDEDEKVVSVQAVRLDHLGSMPLANHWQQQQRRIYVDPYPEQQASLGDRHCPDAQIICGTCAYHGNMWLTPDWKGKRLGQPLCRLGQLLAHARWPLDYIYCFIETRLVSKGFAAHQGYNHICPVGTDWIRTPSHIHADDYLCWNRPEDLDHLAMVTSRSASALPSYTPEPAPPPASA